MQLVVGLILTIILIVGLGYRENGILYGRLGGNIVLLLLLLPQIYKFRPRLEMRNAFEMLKIGVPLVPATFATMWISMSPRFFIEHFGSTAEVGIFAMSSKVASIMSLIFIQPFSMVWMVSLFKIHHLPDATKIYARVLTYYILLGGTLALALAASAPTIVELLGNKKFPLSPQVISIVSLAYVTSGLMYPLNIGPYVKNATRTQLKPFVLSMFMSIIIVWPLTLSLKVVGAAVSLFLVYVLQSLLLGRLSNSLYKVEYEWARISKLLGAMAVGYGVICFVPVSPHYGLVALFWPILLVCVIALLLFIVRFPEKAELHELHNIYDRLKTGRKNA